MERAAGLGCPFIYLFLLTRLESEQGLHNREGKLRQSRSTRDWQSLILFL